VEELNEADAQGVVNNNSQLPVQDKLQVKAKGARAEEDPTEGAHKEDSTEEASNQADKANTEGDNRVSREHGAQGPNSNLGALRSSNGEDNSSNGAVSCNSRLSNSPNGLSQLKRNNREPLSRELLGALSLRSNGDRANLSNSLRLCLNSRRQIQRISRDHKVEEVQEEMKELVKDLKLPPPVQEAQPQEKGAAEMVQLEEG